MSYAVRATSVTIQNLLQQGIKADQDLNSYFTAVGGVVSLATPDEMDAAGQVGLSIWLYRLVRDEQTLNLPPWRPSPMRLRRQPLPLRLHYLMTPIISSQGGAATQETEQHLLGLVLQTFNDKPLLTGVDLADAFVGSGIELAVRLETIELENLARLWDSLERSYQLCISYEVGVVPIESGLEDLPEAPVAAVLPNYGLGTLVSTS